MNKLLYILILLTVVTGCKKYKELHGSLLVSGQITDQVTGAPIPNAVVHLLKMEKVNIGLGKIGDRVIVTDPIATVATDASGNYFFSIDANGEFGFEVLAVPADPLYVSSEHTKSPDRFIYDIGHYNINLECYRSAYLEINVINGTPIDTAEILQFRAVETIRLEDFYKDTTVYLKLVGRHDQENFIDIDIRKNGIRYDSEIYKTAGPWDTISMDYRY